MNKLFGWSFASFDVLWALAAAMLMATPSLTNNVNPTYLSVSASQELPTVLSATNSNWNIVAANSRD